MATDSTGEKPHNKIASLSLQDVLGAGREANVFVERERRGGGAAVAQLQLR